MTDMGSMNRNFKNPIKEVKLKVIDVCGGGERTEKIKKRKLSKNVKKGYIQNMRMNITLALLKAAFLCNRK